MKPLSTNEVAKAIGVHPITVEKWIADKKIKGPKRLHVGARIIRLWTQADVKRLKKFKQSQGRGRKPKGGRK